MELHQRVYDAMKYSIRRPENGFDYTGIKATTGNVL